MLESALGLFLRARFSWNHLHITAAHCCCKVKKHLRQGQKRKGKPDMFRLRAMDKVRFRNTPGEPVLLRPSVRRAGIFAGPCSASVFLASACLGRRIRERALLLPADDVNCSGMVSSNRIRIILIDPDSRFHFSALSRRNNCTTNANRNASGMIPPENTHPLRSPPSRGSPRLTGAALFAP